MPVDLSKLSPQALSSAMRGGVGWLDKSTMPQSGRFFIRAPDYRNELKAFRIWIPERRSQSFYNGIAAKVQGWQPLPSGTTIKVLPDDRPAPAKGESA